MGRYQGERWLVPLAGPVIVGVEPFFQKRPVQGAVAKTPFLSISAILERTKRFYDLKFEPSVDLVTSQGSHRCSVVTGEKRPNVSLPIPRAVKVWADIETAFARKIELGWDAHDGGAWLAASAELIDQPELPDDFFQHQSHHKSERRVISNREE